MSKPDSPISTRPLNLDDLTDAGFLQFIGWVKGSMREERGDGPAIRRIVNEFLKVVARDTRAGKAYGLRALRPEVAAEVIGGTIE